MIQGIKNTAKSSIIYGLGNVSTKLVGIVLLPLFTNTELLTIEEFGVLGVVDVSMQILVSLLSLSLYQAYFRWYWDKNYLEERRSIFFTIFIFLLLVVGIITLISFFTATSLSLLLFNKELFARVVFLMFGSSALQIISHLPLTMMRLEERPVLYTVTNVSKLVISLILTVLFLTKMNRGLEGIYEAQVIANIIAILITFTYTLKRLQPKINFPVLKEMLAYSLPLSIASVSGIALATLDRYVLNYRATLLDVGLYTLAFRIANTIRVFIVHSLQLALAPTIFKLMNHPDNKVIYARIMTYFSLLVVYASLGISIFGLEILTIFASDDIYHSAYKLIPIICLGIFFGTAKDIAINGLNIVKKTKIISVIVPLIAVFHLAINYLLIPLMGVYGAALASVISQLILLILVIFFAQKYYPIPFEYSRVFSILSLAIVLFFVGFQFNHLDIWIRLLIKTLIVIAYPIILWIASFPKDDERKWVLDFLNSATSIFKKS